MCTHCQFSFTSFSRSFIPRVIDWLFHTNGIVGIWNVAWKTEKNFDVVPSRGSENNKCFSQLFPIVRISKINVNLRYGYENLLWISLLVIPSSKIPDILRVWSRQDHFWWIISQRSKQSLDYFAKIFWRIKERNVNLTKPE